MKTFKQTSDEPYMRHYYKIVAQNGTEIVVDNYHDVYVTWMQLPDLSHVEVLDEPPNRTSTC